MSEEKKEKSHLQRRPVPAGPYGVIKHWGETRVVGKRVPRVDAHERVSGSAVYPSDVLLPGMLYGAILRSPHPHAMVTGIHVGKAEKAPGIHAVITCDSPEAQIDWPYSGNKSARLLDRHCRFEGDPVAAVVAETPHQAKDALRAVQVHYEVLPHVVSYERAFENPKVTVHVEGNNVKQERYERGDVEQGFEHADVVLEETYHTACELHTPVELHGCVAAWEGDSLTLWESTQGVYAVQSKVARVLGMPLSRVRVIGHYMGGGFGSKLEPGKYTIIAALLARKTGRPVKLFLSREETFLVVGNRPPCTMKLKAGVKKDGVLTALEFQCLASGGAYPAGGISLVDWLVRDLYQCPHVRVTGTDVYTHTGPARPFRAPGHPQGAWALEQMMDALAAAISMDPVELRLKNIPAFSQAREGNPPYTTMGLRQCIENGAERFAWKKAREGTAREKKEGKHVRRGVGMAAASWFVGGGWPPATVVARLFPDGSLNLNMGASDIGTGTKTVMAMTAAEEMGIDLKAIRIENADTGTTQYASPSGGSKTVPTEAPAVRAAVVEIQRQLLEMAARELDEKPSSLYFLNGDIVSMKDIHRRKAVTDLSGLEKSGVVVGVGYRGPNPEQRAVVPFAAQFCEVEVNMKTGEVSILRFVAVNDSGRVMNRLTYDNQVFGGITMGIGFALTEKRVLDGNITGRMLNRNWHDYKLPTAMDVPVDMASHPVEMIDTEANTVGAKGLGEPVTIPTAAAVANAIHDALGIRFTSTPITPMEIIRALATVRKEH